MSRRLRPFTIQHARLPARVAKRLVLPVPAAAPIAKRRRAAFARDIAAAEFRGRR